MQVGIARGTDHGVPYPLARQPLVHIAAPHQLVALKERPLATGIAYVDCQLHSIGFNGGDGLMGFIGISLLIVSGDTPAIKHIHRPVCPQGAEAAHGVARLLNLRIQFGMFLFGEFAKHIVHLVSAAEVAAHSDA